MTGVKEKEHLERFVLCTITNYDSHLCIMLENDAVLNFENGYWWHCNYGSLVADDTGGQCEPDSNFCRC